MQFAKAGGVLPRFSTRESEVLPELTELVFRQLPAALYTTLVLAALVVYVLWEPVPASRLLAWLTVVYAVSILRLVFWRWHRSHPGVLSCERWLRLYAAGALAAGVVWGGMPLLFYSDTSPATNVFVAFVMGGLVAGASNSLAPLKGTTRLFIGLLCLPLATLFILDGHSLDLVMGTMLLVYGGAYMVMSNNTARMVVDSLALRHENLREIEERKKAEAQLLSSQQSLEETVALRTEELRTANDELTREITVRKQADARVRVSEKRYRSLVESSSDWIWEIDREGTYIYSSPSVKAVLGYSPEEIEGRGFHDLVFGDDADETKARFASHLAGGRAFSQLTRHCLHKDGTERVLESNGEPILNESGSLAGYRGIDRDITLRVRHEEELRKIKHLESLGTLAGGLAHDFNNLLTAVYGNIDLARTDIAADSDAGRALAESVAAMEQARTLTDRLLTFSKGGSPMLEAISVGEMIRDCCRVAFDRTDIRCEYNIAEDLWLAGVDPRQIWQVLDNILTNAREAMPDGGLAEVSAKNVTVDEKSSRRRSLASGDYLELSIRDEGVGISKGDLPRVFDPYFSTKVRGTQKGTGIGLAVCHSVIEKHGGHITVESELRRGTTVRFFLPALRATRPVSRPTVG